jgi:hypothetical protein
MALTGKKPQHLLPFNVFKKGMVKLYIPIASSIEDDVIVSYSRRTIVPEESYERSIRLLDEPQNEYPEGTRDYTFDVCEYIEDHAISKW